MDKGQKCGFGAYSRVYDISTDKKGSSTKEILKRNMILKGTEGFGSLRECCLLNHFRNHPHIIELKKMTKGSPFKTAFSPAHHDDIDDQYHFIFEKASCTLHDEIYRIKGTVPYTSIDIKQIIVQILLGIEYMHLCDVSHRDIKPENVLIFYQQTPLGVSKTVKICDLGFAKTLSVSQTCSPRVMTSWYRAPEICLHKDYDKKCDVWSIGCLIYQMLTRKPFIECKIDDDFLLIQEIIKQLGSACIPSDFETHRLDIFNTASLNILKNNVEAAIKTSTSTLGIPVNQPQLTGIPWISYIKQIIGASPEALQYIDLLSKMIVVDPRKRLTISQALDHQIFDTLRAYINEIRNKYVPKVYGIGNPFTFYRCNENTWIIQAALRYFGKRHINSTYDTRSLFQAIDLFSRYITAMMTLPDIRNNKETSLKGRVNTEEEALIRFIACYHIAKKYFNTACIPTTLRSITNSIDPLMTLDQGKFFIIEQFEKDLIFGCLQCQVYRETIYEAYGKITGQKINDDIVREMLIFLSDYQNEKYSGMKCAQDFIKYQESKKITK